MPKPKGNGKRKGKGKGKGKTKGKGKGKGKGKRKRKGKGKRSPGLSTPILPCTSCSQALRVPSKQVARVLLCQGPE
jgi:hypothetical protein